MHVKRHSVFIDLSYLTISEFLPLLQAQTLDCQAVYSGSLTIIDKRRCDILLLNIARICNLRSHGLPHPPKNGFPFSDPVC